MGMVFMAKAKWDALSDEARAAIEKHSGCGATREFGKFIDGWEAGAQAMIGGQEGHTITEATPEQVKALTEAHWPGLVAGFSHAVPGGAELIEAFQAELEKASANGS